MLELRWPHSPVGVFKLNVDGAISLKGLNRGVGAVIRDEDEVFMACCSKQDLVCFDASTTELWQQRRDWYLHMTLGFMLLFGT